MRASDHPRVDPRTRRLLERYGGPGAEIQPRPFEELLDLADRALARGRFTEAELHLRHAYRAARSGASEERLGRVGVLLGWTLLEQGALGASAGVLRSVAEIPLEPSERARWHMLMGHLLRALCRRDLAEDHFRLSVEAGAEGGADRFEAYALSELASVRGIVGEVAEGERLYDRSLAILREDPDEVEPAGLTLVNLAALLLHGEEIDRAVEALESASALPDPSLKLAAQIDLHYAEAAILSGETDLARTVCREAEIAVERAGMHDARSHLLVLRTVMANGAGPASPEELAEEAGRLLSAGRSHDGAMLHSLAGVLAERRGSDPERHFDAALRAARGAAPAAVFRDHQRRLFASARRPTRRRMPPGGPAGSSVASRIPRDDRGEGEEPVLTLEVLLFSPDRRLAERIQGRLWGVRRLVAVKEWRRLRRLASAADCLVLVLPRIDGTLTRRRLLELKRSTPFVPVVLVTERDADNARHLVELDVEEVIWLSEVDAGVRPALRRATSRGLMRWVARTLRSDDRLEASLREALVHACRSPEPVTSVEELAEAVGCHRTTLARQWRRAVGTEHPARLEDALAWIVLLRALGRKPPAMGWEHAAREVGVHPKTLRAWARRLVGRGLAELDEHGQRWVAERFVAELLTPILRPERG